MLPFPFPPLLCVANTTTSQSKSLQLIVSYIVKIDVLHSDLPSEDRSTVLLLGVTRIPTSPAAARRYHPSSEAAALRHHQPLRRNSSAASIKRAAVVRRNPSARRPIETGRFQVDVVGMRVCSFLITLKFLVT